MSKIKSYVEQNLPKAKAKRFKEEVLPQLLDLSPSMSEKIYYLGTTNVEQLHKIAAFLGCDLIELYDFPDWKQTTLNRFIKEVQL